MGGGAYISKTELLFKSREEIEERCAHVVHQEVALQEDKVKVAYKVSA